MNQKQIEKILNHPGFWPENLKTNVSYYRCTDDSDGFYVNNGIFVSFDQMGDAYIKTISQNLFGSVRYRTWGGGGRSLRVRNALLLLAEAIRLDNEEKPDPIE